MIQIAFNWGYLILRRMVGGVVAVILASVLAFYILEASPGTILNALLGDEAGIKQQEELRVSLYLNEPVHIRYFRYLQNLVRGDLGISLISGRPVADMISQRFINTLILTSLAISTAVLIGFTLGAWTAIRSGSPVDLIVLLFTAFCLASPSFLTAMLLTQFLSVELGWLPAVGGDTIYHYVLPCLALMIPTAAVITRMVRSRMLDEIQKEYILTARAKGLTTGYVWRKHVFINALVPALTLTGIQFGHLLGGAFVVETIFAFPGLGRLTVQSIFDRDYPVVLASVILSAFLFQTLNSLVDIIHQKLDPRLNQGGEHGSF